MGGEDEDVLRWNFQGAQWITAAIRLSLRSADRYVNSSGHDSLIGLLRTSGIHELPT